MLKKEKANAKRIIEFIRNSKRMEPMKIVDSEIPEFKKDLKDLK